MSHLPQGDVEKRVWHDADEVERRDQRRDPVLVDRCMGRRRSVNRIREDKPQGARTE